MDNWQIALSVVAILFGGGGVISFFAFLVNAKRAEAQNSLDLSHAWETFAAPLMERVKYLETHTHEQDKEITSLIEQVSDQESEIEDLRGWAERLVRQIIELGGVPVVFTKRKHRKEDE